MSAASSTLFTPIRVGNMNLSHRLVFAPLTRFRANRAHTHTDIGVTQYAQRSTEPGTLLLSEATIIAPRAGGYSNAPGIWSDDQVAAWKRVTDAVHAHGSYIYLQLWALGRAADPDVLKDEGPNITLVSASDVPLTGQALSPRPLSVAEIKEYVQLYVQAASNAVNRAGFDGVEVHSANGYLLDQFLQSVSNKRTDEYGGSVENRARFPLEVLQAVTKEIGQERTAFRISPWGRFNEMRGNEDPRPQFSYLVQQVKERFPALAFLDIVEPRVEGVVDRVVEEGDSNDFIREIWEPKKHPLVSAGAYTRETALEVSEQKGDIISIGRYWISNPDLVQRLRNNLPLVPYDRNTFYTAEDPKGYIDYPFLNGQLGQLANM